jgi:hypothetical protein
MFGQFSAALIMLRELKFAVRRQRIFVFNFTYLTNIIKKKYFGIVIPILSDTQQ